ncbi:CaiB/BaiF CoA transferase family protein, partial [Chloroflexota bacterium]
NVVGWPDREPTGIFGAYTDIASPFYLLSMLVAALDYRRRTGKGIYMDLSQFEAGTSLLGPAILDYSVNYRVAVRSGNRHQYAVPHAAFPCKGDDRWIAIGVFSDTEWQSFCKVLGNPEWATGPRFNTFLSRKHHEDELEDYISKWTANHIAEEVMTWMQEAGVPAGIVARIQDLFADQQLKHRQHFRVLEHKVIGPHAYNAPAYRLSKTPCDITKAAPSIGEDNEYVLREVLGYSDEEIADMLISGAVTTEEQ